MSPLFYLLHSSENTGKMLPAFPSLCLSSLSVVEYSILPLFSDEQSIKSSAFRLLQILFLYAERRTHFVCYTSFIEKRTKLQCLKKFSFQKGTIFSKIFAVFAEFLVLQTMFSKVWPASLQIRPCFLKLAKIGDTEIFAKMAYGTVTSMYDDLYILTYGVKGSCRIREVTPHLFQ